MLDPFGIVKPILGQYYLSIAKSLAEPMALFLDIVTRSCATNLAIVNPHWKGVNFYRPFSTNKDLAEAMFLAENSEYASEKVLCVVYCVECYQIRPKNPFEYSLPHLVRSRWDRSVGAKGVVEKNPD